MRAGEAACLKSWGVGARECSLRPCWKRLQLWKRSLCLPRGAMKAPAQLGSCHWDLELGTSVLVLPSFYWEKGAPGLPGSPSLLPSLPTSPPLRLPLSILTSFIHNAVPLKWLSLVRPPSPPSASQFSSPALKRNDGHSSHQGRANFSCFPRESTETNPQP